MVQQLGEEKAKALQPYSQVGALTKSQAELILKTIWPDAPEVEVLKAAIICRQYGLNPLMKHLFLLPFKKYDKKTGEVIRVDWAIALGIKANRLIARRVDRYSYLDGTPRVMTKQEQETIFGAVDPANIWAITKLQDSNGNQAPGYGSWPKDQPAYGADRGNSPANMAFIHSERNALDRLFPGEMPQDVGVIDEKYIEGEYTVAPDMPPDKKTPLISPPGGQKAEDATKTVRTQKEKKADNKVGETAQRSPDPGDGHDGDKSKAAPSEVAGEGFHIELGWLTETLAIIKWSEDTVRSWIAQKFPGVNTDGKLIDVLGRLTRGQADVFTKELQDRADKMQPKLFK